MKAIYDLQKIKFKLKGLLLVLMLLFLGAQVMAQSSASTTAGPPLIICQGSALTLTGNLTVSPIVPALETILWTWVSSPAGETFTTTSTTSGLIGNSVTTSVIPTLVPGSSRTYTLTASSPTATFSPVISLATALVTVNALPTATVTGTTTICQNGTSPNITFTGATGTSPYVFSYNVNGGTETTVSSVSGSTATVAAPTATAGTFTYNLLSVQDANGCSQSQTGSATITVDPTPTTATAGAVTNVCITGAATLAGNTPSVGVGAWSGAGLTFGNAGSGTSTVTASTAGTYVATWTITNGSCAASTATCSVTFDALPTVATAGAVTTVCVTAAATLAGNIPSVGTGTWTKLTGPGTVNFGNANSGTSTATTTSAGTYTLQWSIVNGTCAASTATCSVTFDASPTVATAGAVSNVCITEAATLAGNTPSVGVGAWSGTGLTFGNAGSGTSSVTASTAGTYVATWTITNGTCAASTATCSVTFDAAPTTATAGSVATLCVTGTATLAGNIPSVGTGTWTKLTGPGTVNFGNANSGTSTATVTTAGTYTLQWSIANGTCAASTATCSVTFDASPTVATAGAVANVCVTASATLAGNIPSVGTGTWSQISGGTGTGTVTFGNSHSGTSTAAATTAGSYILQWSIANGTCAASTATCSVTFDAAPTTATAGAVAAFCNNSTGILAGNTPVVGTGTWTKLTGPGTVTFGNANLGNTTVTIAEAGTYILQWSIANGTCAASTATCSVTVNPAPVATYSGATSVCVGATTPLSASGSWYGANWVSLNPEFATVSVSGVVTGVAAGTTTITLTLTSEFACTTTHYFPMQVVATAGTPSTPSGSTSLCQGAVPTAYTTSSLYATSYLWSVTGTGNSISGTSTTGTVTWAAGFSGSANISVTASNACGTSSTSSVTVTVIPTVGTPTAPAGTTSRCSGTGTSAYTTSASNATTYNWSVTGTGNSISGTSTTGTVTWSAGFSGSAVVSVTATNSCGTSTSTSTTVTVTPSVGTPSAPAGLTTICQGTASGTYTTTATNATSYTWYVTGTGNSISGTSTTGTVTWNPGFSGSADITVVANGCGTATSTATTVTVNPLVGTPIAPAGLTSICQGTASGTYTTTATNAVSYAWTLTPSAAGSIAGTSTTGTVTWNPSYSGTATILVSGTNGCGTATSTATTVTVKPLPLVVADYAPKPICNGATLSLIATPDWQTQYEWTATNGFHNTGPNSIITLNNVTSANNGIYTVTVTGLNGCSASASTTVTISETVGTPSAITVTGTEPTCQILNNTTTTTYNTTAAFASGYNWSLSNPAAGTLSSTTTIGTNLVTWTNGFSGSVSILVSANGCSGPSATVSRTITITPSVGIPTTPSGIASRCQGAGTSAYTTSASNATSYNWSVTGTGNSISGTSTTGTVTWAAGYSGSAVVSVTATNSCGTSTSATTTVTVSPSVGTPVAPSGLTTICQGTASGTYTTTATNATSYTWYITGTGNSISGTSTTGTVTWSPSFNGDANITVVANGCGTATSTATTVHVTPTASTPSAPSGITSRCQGAGTSAFTTSATNATSYTWAVSGTGNTISGTSTTGTVTWNPTFSGTAIISVFANGCGTSATATSAVTVTPAPDVTAESNSPVCIGGVLILTASSTAPNTNYAWTGPSSFIYSGPNTEITFSPMASANAGTYTLTVTAPGYCSVIKTVVVTLAPTTVGGTVTSTQTICYNTQPNNLTLSGNVGSVVEWQSSANAAFTSPVHIAVTSTTLLGTTIGSLVSNTYFRAMVQSGTCSVTASASVLITVDPLVDVPTVTPTEPTCAVATGSLQITAPTGPGMTYSIGGTYTSTTLFSGLTAGGTYTVTARNADGCVSNGYVYTFGPQPWTPPTPTVSVTQQPTCSVPTGTIVISAPTATGMTYSIDGTTYVNTTGIFTLVAPGTYTATAKSMAGCISNGTSVTVNSVPALPTVFTVTGGGSYCQNGTGVAIGLSGSQTGVNYTLKLGATTIATIAGTGTATTFGLQTAAGTYSVTATNATTLCTSNMNGSATIVINPLPATPTVIATSPACTGSTGTFAVVVPLMSENFTSNVMPPAGWSLDGGFNSHWSTSSTAYAGGVAPEAHFSYAPGGIGTSRLISPQVNTTGNTTIYLTFKTMYDIYGPPVPTISVATRSGSGAWHTVWETNTGVAAQTVAVTISNSDVGAADFQIGFFIDGDFWYMNDWYLDNILLSTTAASSTGVTYAWSVTGTGNTITGSGTTATVNWNPAFSGVATVGVSATNACGTTTTSTTNVTVTSAPVAPTTPIGQLYNCPGQSASYSTAAVTGASGYTWSVTGAGNQIFQNGLSAYVIWGAGFSGTASVTVTASNACGTSAPASLGVTVFAIPVATATSNTPVCEGGTLELTAGPVGANYTYVWSGPNGFSVTTVQPVVTISPVTLNSSGNYTLAVYTTVNGVGTFCPGTTSTTVTINPVPTTPTISVVSTCGNAVLTAHNYTGTLLWSTGATTASITVSASGIYTVNQTVGTCTSESGTVSVTIAPCGGTIAGYMNYDNDYLTGMNGVTINLNTPSGSLVASTLTTFDNAGGLGYYSFTGVSAGTYSVTADFNGAWLGNNATDALIVNLSTIGAWQLIGLRAIVADVNNDGKITGVDALQIKDRTSGVIDHYAAGNWKFTSATVTIVSTETVNANLLALCTGDVNGSDMPGSLKNAALLTAIDGELMTVPVNQTFTYDIKSSVVAKLGAMTLFMNYDANLFTIDKVNSSVDGMSYKIEDGRIAIAWSNTNPLRVKMDETVISLKMTVKEALTEPVQIFTINDGSEFADPLANKITNFDLKMSKVITSESNLEFSMVNYPNPFKTFTEIVYTIPVDGKVRLVLTNMFGQQIRTLVDEQQAAGIYKVKVNSVDANLEPGLYLYSIEVEGTTTRFTKTNKMLFTR